MANSWRRNQQIKILTPKNLLLFFFTSLLLLIFLYLTSQTQQPHTKSIEKTIFNVPITPFNCYNSQQAYPIIANIVEGVKYPFLFSLSDFGNLPEKPHKNIQRILKGKPFRRPDISVTIQEFLEKMKGKNGIVIDVGANVGMASFAAAVMGFKVLAFEPVFENLQKICEGIYFNRVGELVEVYEAAVSDHNGNITFHKLVGRLDNSAVSATGAKLAFKSNEEIEVQVKTIPLDEVIQETERVLLIKIDVQGWEYHVLKGASKILSRKKGEAPYLIYEEDERLLQASNSSTKEIREFLRSVGYNRCTQHGTDAHCTKTD
ncbi:putative methyl-CpG-binding domain-containing protein 10-like [Capsicum annuum]|uniref:Methyltransferase FkbM domain-containing protein n=1 Tax=Capsicum annuum TaxID=4072 RepID=A0A1U8E136_CAPAN|nr:uncharacterized protein LOC107840745 [Capsicum annuum]KAF3636032.1 putative methyl-CpG-binding domain-containing protein 10-like [Capsicum annuum]PHT73684.1 hypothetical protein T459_24469 [Capsicum annuum]